MWVGDFRCPGRKKMSKYHLNHYKHWKDKFFIVRVWGRSSMVIVEVDGAPRFHMSWIEYPNTIISFDLDYLTLIEKEVV